MQEENSEREELRNLTTKCLVDYFSSYTCALLGAIFTDRGSAAVLFHLKAQTLSNCTAWMNGK